MDKLMRILIIVLIAAFGCSSPATYTAPEPTVELSPVTVIHDANESWNAGDFQALKAIYADDAEVCFPNWGDECTRGAEAIGAWIDELAAANFVIEPQSVKADGDTVTVEAKVWADETRELGIAPLVTTDVYTVEDGQITSQTSTLSEASAASLKNAIQTVESTSVINAAMEAWNTGDVGVLKRFYADDAEACFPDWGEECIRCSEAIGAWIEDLVGANFAIEPENIEADGNTVTVLARVWADETRELGIAPLMTTDVYKVSGNQITRQNSTLSEESAASYMNALSSQPSAVVMAFVEAINAGDLETASALCHKDFYAELIPTLIPGFANLSGGMKNDIRAWLEKAIALHTQIETEILSQEGSEVKTRSLVSSDYIQELGAAPLVVNETFKVQDGQVRSWYRSMAVDSLSEVQEGLVKLEIPDSITPEPGEVLASKISDLVGVWIGTIAGGFEGPVEFEPNGKYNMEGDSGSFWFEEPYLLMKTEREHYGGDPIHSCKKGLIGSYVVYASRSGGRSVGLRYIPILDLCTVRKSFLEGEVHTPR